MSKPKETTFQYFSHGIPRHATILAALRLWQQDAAHIADGDGSIIAIAEEAGVPLSNKSTRV